MLVACTGQQVDLTSPDVLVQCPGDNACPAGKKCVERVCVMVSTGEEQSDEGTGGSENEGEGEGAVDASEEPPNEGGDEGGDEEPPDEGGDEVAADFEPGEGEGRGEGEGEASGDCPEWDPARALWVANAAGVARHDLTPLYEPGNLAADPAAFPLPAEIAAGGVVRLVLANSGLTGVALTANAEGSPGSVVLLNLVDGQARRVELAADPAQTGELALSADGQILAVLLRGGEQDLLAMVDVQAGVRLTLDPEAGGVRNRLVGTAHDVAITGNGRILLATGAAGELTEFRLDAPRDEQLRPLALPGIEGRVLAVTATSDPSTVLVNATGSVVLADVGPAGNDEVRIVASAAAAPQEQDAPVLRALSGSLNDPLLVYGVVQAQVGGMHRASVAMWRLDPGGRGAGPTWHRALVQAALPEELPEGFFLAATADDRYLLVGVRGEERVRSFFMLDQVPAADLDTGPLGDFALRRRTPVERCNAADDDCDGQFDEGFDLGALCVGPGLCSDEDGVIQCLAADRSGCSTGAGGSDDRGVEEICNGLDDDCDGVPDNGNLGTGDACDTGLLGMCVFGTHGSGDGEPGCVPDVEPTLEQCDALDHDCDGDSDDVPILDVGPVHVAAGSDTSPGLAWTGHGWQVAWVQWPDILTQAFSPDGEPLGEPIHLQVAEQRHGLQVVDVVAGANGEFAIFWSGVRDQPAVYGTLFDAAGRRRFDEDIVVSDPEFGSQERGSDAARGPGGYGVVGIDRDESRVWFSLVADDGTVRRHLVPGVNPGNGQLSGFAAITGDDDGFAVAYGGPQDDGIRDLMFVRLTPDALARGGLGRSPTPAAANLRYPLSGRARSTDWPGPSRGRTAPTPPTSHGSTPRAAGWRGSWGSPAGWTDSDISSRRWPKTGRAISWRGGGGPPTETR